VEPQNSHIVLTIESLHSLKASIPLAQCVCRSLTLSLWVLKDRTATSNLPKIIV